MAKPAYHPRRRHRVARCDRDRGRRSLLLALLVWLGRWPRLVLLGVAAFGLVFAAGDGRELVHQLDESNGGLAAIAAILIGLHLAVTTLAAALFPRRTGAGELTAAKPLA